MRHSPKDGKESPGKDTPGGGGGGVAEGGVVGKMVALESVRLQCRDAESEEDWLA